jgi:hypothetical protein
VTYIVTSEFDLNQVAAPNLPLATEEYSRAYADQLNNVLRLYFNRLDSILGQLQVGSVTTSGAGFTFPSGAFHQDGYTTLTNAIPTSGSTATIVVGSTTNFASAGTILIQKELISYTGKTATTFTGITRSQYGSSGASHAAGVYVTEAQAVPSATTALALPFDTTDISNGVSLDATDKSKIVFATAGYYNVQFSIQLLNAKSSIDNVTLWFRQNTVDIPYSTGIATVPLGPGTTLGASLVAWNLVLPINAGDNIQLMMASESGDTVAGTYPPGTAPVHPAAPSIILTATFVSALP